MAEPESLNTVYDKAKYHRDSEDYPSRLSPTQAFVHTGMFLAWLVERDLCSEDFLADSGDEIGKLKKRGLTGAQLYESWDGVLHSEMLSPEGNAFATDYFDFEHGRFAEDYVQLLAAKLPTLFHVKDTWANYDRLKKRIDQRFAQWREDPKRVRLKKSVVVEPEPHRKAFNHARRYNLHLLFGSRPAAPLWHWKQWGPLVQPLEDLLNHARARAAVESFQWMTRDGQFVKFGQLSFSAKSHPRWVHEAPGNPASKRWTFWYTKVRAPGAAQCFRESQPPDIYFEVRNLNVHGTKVGFGPMVTLAVAEDLIVAARDSLHTVLAALSKTLDAKLHAHCARTWAVKGNVGYSACLDDDFAPMEKTSGRQPNLKMLETFENLPWRKWHG